MHLLKLPSEVKQTTTLKPLIRHKRADADQPSSALAEQTLEAATQKGYYNYWLQHQDIADIARLEYHYGTVESSTLFDIVGSTQHLSYQLQQFQTKVSQNHETRSLTLIVNLGKVHWVTLVIFHQNGQFYGYYVDSLGNKIPDDIQQALRSAQITNLFDFHFPQQIDGHNCGFWALENAVDLNRMLQGNHPWDWVVTQLKRPRDEAHFRARRQYLAGQLRTDPTRLNRHSEHASADPVLNSDSQQPKQSSLNPSEQGTLQGNRELERFLALLSSRESFEKEYRKLYSEEGTPIYYDNHRVANLLLISAPPQEDNRPLHDLLSDTSTVYIFSEQDNGFYYISQGQTAHTLKVKNLPIRDSNRLEALKTDLGIHTARLNADEAYRLIQVLDVERLQKITDVTGHTPRKYYYHDQGQRAYLDPKDVNLHSVKVLYLQALMAINEAIKTSDIDRLKQLNQLLGYIQAIENRTVLKTFYEDSHNPLKATNIIILACEYNRLEVLEYLFNDQTAILDHLSTAKPSDTDKEGHTAFYYAIHSGNVNLLNILMQWPVKYRASPFDPQALTNLLSDALFSDTEKRQPPSININVAGVRVSDEKNIIQNNIIKATAIEITQNLPSPPAKHLPKQWKLPLRNLNFTGREDLLNQITDHFRQDSTPVVLTTHGLGGIGKTQLALEFAWRHHQEYIGIVWFNAENQDQLLKEYIKLGLHLHIVHQDENDSPISDRADRVKQWLEGRAGWLLVYDNAPNLASIRDLLPVTGGKVLVTSRDGEKALKSRCLHWRSQELIFRKY